MGAFYNMDSGHGWGLFFPAHHSKRSRTISGITVRIASEPHNRSDASSSDREAHFAASILIVTRFDCQDIYFDETPDA